MVFTRLVAAIGAGGSRSGRKDMRHRRWVRIAVLGCSMGMLLVGCRRWRGQGAEGDVVTPGALEGDYVLSERIEDGMRITDVNFESVYFHYDSYVVLESEVGKIERVADYLRGNAGVRLVVEGHCDERGSREYNLSLGEHRALAVRAHLIGLGTDAGRIQTRSYGEENPLDPGHSESAWRLNRRCEFALYR